MSEDVKANPSVPADKDAVDTALNSREDSKKAARSQLFDAMSEYKQALDSEEAEDTAEETADAPETTEDTPELESEPVEKTEDVSEEVEDSEEESEEESTGESIDAYKAKLDEEIARRERAEKKILKLKKEDKDGASNSTPDVNVNDIVEAARKLVREEQLAIREQEVNEILEESLGELTDNASERELIEYHYNNTINQSGITKKSIQQDLRRAKLLANEDKLLSENRELKQALVSKSTTSTAPEFSGRRLEERRGPKLSGADKTLLKKFGINEKELAKKLK